jgi:hypothetical protein
MKISTSFRSFSAALTLTALAAVPAAAVQPVACDSDSAAAASRAEYAKAVRTAAPDTPYYAAHPFPRTDEQAIDDFVEFHTRAFGSLDVAVMPAAERRFFAALAADRVHFEVARVANWSPLRCGPRKARRYYFLIRAFDSETGTELLRVTVDDAGHVAHLRHKPEGRSLRPIPELAEARQQAAALLAGTPHDARYVTAWGSLRCDDLVPCIAMEGDAETLLMDGSTGDLYRIRDAGKRFSFRTDLSPARRALTWDAARRAGGELITLGGDTVAVAQPLARIATE